MTTTVVTVNVSCVSPHGGAPVPHRVHLSSHGRVTTPDHDAEEWSHDSATMRALGANEQISGCEYWRTVRPLDVVRLQRRSPQIVGELVWNEGTFRTSALGGFPDHSETINPFAWEYTFTQEPWGSKAKNTFFTAVGINTFISAAFASAGYTYLHDRPNEALDYLRAIGPALHTDTAYLSRMGELRFPTDDLNEIGVTAPGISEWVNLGVSPYEIPAWLHRGGTPKSVGQLLDAWHRTHPNVESSQAGQLLLGFVETKFGSTHQAVDDALTSAGDHGGYLLDSIPLKPRRV